MALLFSRCFSVSSLSDRKLKTKYSPLWFLAMILDWNCGGSPLIISTLEVSSRMVAFEPSNDKASLFEPVLFERKACFDFSRHFSSKALIFLCRQMKIETANNKITALAMSIKSCLLLSVFGEA